MPATEIQDPRRVAAASYCPAALRSLPVSEPAAREQYQPHMLSCLNAEHEVMRLR